MGLMNWLREILSVNHKYTIKQTYLEMPKGGECIVFQFPNDTPEPLIKQFDRRIVEFQNGDRKFITTNLEMEIKKINKKDMKTKEDDENSKSNIVEGHKESKKER